MSTARLPHPHEKLHQKPLHRRHDSGELDVFDATRYFSGATELPSHHKDTAKEDRHAWRNIGRRTSLDAPMRHSFPPQTHTMEKQTTSKVKNYKHPMTSPRGKLASFLNSLFNQTSSKKKKPSYSSTAQSVKVDEDRESESRFGGRRRRRSSISHFKSPSSSCSGFRTPPPLKYYVSDHQQMVTLPSDQEREYSWFDHDKFKFINGVDDGGDSDSSSDLFELKNHDLGYFSSTGLPVYETTGIKRGAPISNGST